MNLLKNSKHKTLNTFEIMKKIQQVVSVSLTYKRVGAAMASVFLGWIIARLTGNTAFPKPPIPLVPPTPPDPDAPVDLTTRKARLDAAITARQGGGTLATAEQAAALQSVFDGLDATAFYCQTTARHDLPTFLTSGFQPASKNTSQSELDTPTVTGISNDKAGELDAHLTPIDNAVGYEVQTSLNGTDWTTVKFSTQARTIALTGLTTGTVVQVRARALGGSTGQSQWSLPMSCVVH
jgi:hypothetical protein